MILLYIPIIDIDMIGILFCLLKPGKYVQKVDFIAFIIYITLHNIILYDFQKRIEFY